MGRREDRLLEFEVARQNRRFEIQMFWQRANYFLVLNTALAVGAYSVDEQAYSLFLGLFGSACSFLWYRTNLGAKFWQAFWEEEVRKISVDFNVRALSLSEDQINAESHSLEDHDGQGSFKRWLNQQIRNSRSVSSNMIILSLITFIAWLHFSAFQLGQIICGLL